MLILGVDPGVDGAFALYTGDKLFAVPMPTELRIAGQRRTERRFIQRGAVAGAARRHGIPFGRAER